MSNPAAAAKMIRQWLKAQGIPARVTSKSYSMGSNVNVYVTDLQPEQAKKVEEYAGQFEMGRFDGMTDCYDYNNRRDDIPQVKYVFVNNAISDPLRQEIWDFARSYYPFLEGAPVDAQEAYNFQVSAFSNYGSDVIYRMFNGSAPAFWAAKAQQVQAAA